MAKKREIDFGLPKADDLFSTQKERDEDHLKKIYDIPIRKIDPFPKHPFKVKDDEDMDNLVESIKERGVITPVTVRQKSDGRYEMLSGHRRKRACELAGLDTIRADVVDMDKDEAIIFMVDSNLQRTTILPSEKAFSYKMKLNAMKRQGKRSDLTSAPSERKFAEARDKIGDEVGESREQVRRYIRLTFLIPPLLKLVDEGQMALRPAVEISYLPRELQESVLVNIEMEDATPSHAQARKMRRMHEEGRLNDDVVASIMEEEKPNQKEKVVLRGEKIKSLFPSDLPPAKREDYVVKAMQFYMNHRKKMKEKEHER